MILLKKLRFYRWYILGRLKIKKQIKNADTIKIIIGSSSTSYNGWISTDLPHFNILKENDWAYFFKPNSIDNLLAEHVLEHLTHEQVENVLSYAFIYLKKGGCFRIAVPDKYHPNPEYIEYVRPGGSGPGAKDHKSFWDYKTINKISENDRFRCSLLEYWDEKGNFNYKDFNEEFGLIQRSKSKGFKTKIENYSSLIIDICKQ